MAGNPVWFDEDHYLNNKLNQLKSLDVGTYGSWSVQRVKNAFTEAGMTPLQHFHNHGDHEGLSPNSWFVMDEYLDNKVAQLQSVDPGGGWTPATVKQAISDAGMGLWEHFQLFGFAELVNPSSHFDVARYLQDKTAQLGGEYTLEEVIQAFQEAGLDVISHYLEHGVNEGLSAYDKEGNVVSAEEISSGGGSGGGGTPPADDGGDGGSGGWSPWGDLADFGLLDNPVISGWLAGFPDIGFNEDIDWESLSDLNLDGWLMELLNALQNLPPPPFDPDAVSDWNDYDAVQNWAEQWILSDAAQQWITQAGQVIQTFMTDVSPDDLLLWSGMNEDQYQAMFDDFAALMGA